MTAGVTLPLVALGKSAVTAFQDSEKVVAQTAAVIKSTGGAAALRPIRLAASPRRFSEYSGIDDEAIAAGENMLLTFTNIQNERRQGQRHF